MELGTKVPDSNCPICKKVLNAALCLDMGGSKPSVNDITICDGCSGILYYKGDLSLELLPNEDYEELPEDLKEQLEMAQKLLKGLKDV